jgi:hypothetical protein
MNRSNLIGALEDRQLFSAYTVVTGRATQPPAAFVGDLHQPLSQKALAHTTANASYSFLTNQTAHSQTF